MCESLVSLVAQFFCTAKSSSLPLRVAEVPPTSDSLLTPADVLFFPFTPAGDDKPLPRLTGV